MAVSRPSQAPLHLALSFERIEIRRMPGFARGGFAVDELTPGVNVIFGPNGSGKSTTARAMRALLWEPAAEGRESLFAIVNIGDETWTVELDAAQREWFKEGVPMLPPPIPAAEGRDRYHLALPDLLVDEDRRFAESIRRESVGGYDIQQAAEAAGFTQAPPGRRTIPDDLKRANRQLKEVRAEQEKLLDDERRLSDLRRQKEAAQAAAKKSTVLDALIDVMREREAVRAAELALAEYPPWMARQYDDDAETLQRLREHIDDKRESIQEWEAALEDARRRRDRLALPADGISEVFVIKLREVGRQLDKWEQDRMAREQSIEAASEERRRAAVDLGGADLAQTGPVDRQVLAQLAQSTEAWDRQQAIRRDLEAEKRRLKDEADAADDPRRLSRAIDLLVRVLGEPEAEMTDDKDRWLGVGGWLVTAGLSLLLTVRIHLSFALLAAGAAAMALWLWLLSRGRPAGGDRGEVYKGEYIASGFDPPAAWQPKDISARIAELHQNLRAAEDEQERAERLARIVEDLKHMQADDEALKTAWSNLAEQLKLPLPTDPAGMWWLVGRLSTWQHAADKVETLAKERDKIVAYMDEAMAAVAPDVASLGYDWPEKTTGIDTTATVKSIIDDVEQRRQAWHDETHTIQRLQEEIDRNREAINAAQKERQNVFSRLDVQEDYVRNGSHSSDDLSGDLHKEALVREAAAQLQDYRTARDEWNGRLHRSRAAERRLMDVLEHGAPAVDTDESPDLDAMTVLDRPFSQWSLDDAEEARQNAEVEKASIQSLTGDIAALETRIQDAKGGSTIEEALSAQTQAEDALADLLERECRIALGSLLADHVHRVAEEQDRPAVFVHARKQFARITRGAFQLELGGTNEPIFHAIDTETGERKQLDQLSSGTRAQLLMAVRVAFVDSAETGVALPIVFDEALANTDDFRADSLINGIIDLAEGGRQIFYFTAQVDEVGKWKTALSQRPGVAHSFINLRDVREVERVRQRPLPDIPRVGSPRVPEPQDLDHSSYGRLLNVPGIDPFAETIGGVHLWHLIEDVQALKQLLSMSIETWGSFQSFYEHGGLDEADAWALDAYEKAAAAARCLETIVVAARIGRGQSLDRQVLIDSGVFTDRFLDSAFELAASCDYDPRRFMQSIDEGGLPRFRQDNKDDLRAYLEDNGYLDERTPLSAEQIHESGIGQIGRDLTAGLVSGDLVERLIATVMSALPDDPDVDE